MGWWELNYYYSFLWVSNEDLVAEVIIIDTK